MDCKLCERELEAYLEGRLTPGQRFQVENHLKECERCSQSLVLEKMTSDTISEEKMMIPSSALSDRVMNVINKGNNATTERKTILLFPPILRKVAYAISVAAAVYIGIIAGNFYLAEESIPAEMSYINDVQIEAVNLFTNEN